MPEVSGPAATSLSMGGVSGPAATSLSMPGGVRPYSYFLEYARGVGQCSYFLEYAGGVGPYIYIYIYLFIFTCSYFLEYAGSERCDPQVRFVCVGNPKFHGKISSYFHVRSQQGKRMSPVLSLGVTGQRRHPQGGVKTYLL